MDRARGWARHLMNVSVANGTDFIRSEVPGRLWRSINPANESRRLFLNRSRGLC
jgi:hypothetical protein